MRIYVPNIMVTPQEITKLFLYGSNELPENLGSDELIRPKGKDDTPFSFIDVDTVVHMNEQTGPGRFALAPNFDYVKEFFTKDQRELENDLLKQPGVIVQTSSDTNPIRYISVTKEQLNEALGFDKQYYYVVKHRDVEDNHDDYAIRTYIFNTIAYSISDDARFIITEDGRRRISNFSIIPTPPNQEGSFQENFDLNGGDGLTSVGNYFLKSLIDPYLIGRRVDINFTGDVLPTTYTIEDYERDVDRISTWKGTNLPKLTIDILALSNELYDDSITQFSTNDKLLVVYGTEENDTIDRVYLSKAYDGINDNFGAQRLPNDYGKNGLAIYSGKGNDRLIGFQTSDQLYGGDGNDVLDGSIGSDGTEYDILTGGNGADTFVISDYTKGEDEVLVNSERLVRFQAEDAALITDFEFGIDRLEGLPDNYQISPVYNSEDSKAVTVAGEFVEFYSIGILTDLEADNDLDSGEQFLAIIADSLDYEDPIFSDTSGQVFGLGSGGDNGTSNTIDGSSGNDQISGSIGDDRIVPGAGDDRIDGGDGVDTVVYPDVSSVGTPINKVGELVTVGDGSNTLVGTDTLTKVELIEFSDTTIDIEALIPVSSIGLDPPVDEDRELILGTDEDDVIQAGSNQNIQVLQGSDTILVSDNSSNNLIFGNEGSDIFILSSVGNNVITGGAGDDDFSIGGELPGAPDTISDFELDIDTITVYDFTQNDITFDENLSGDAVLQINGIDVLVFSNISQSDIEGQPLIFSPIPLALLEQIIDDSLGSVEI